MATVRSLFKGLIGQFFFTRIKLGFPVIHCGLILLNSSFKVIIPLFHCFKRCRHFDSFTCFDAFGVPFIVRLGNKIYIGINQYK